jgi:hypothetical protein
MADGGVLEFEGGVYKITGTYQSGTTKHVYGLKINNDNITLSGGSEVALVFDPPSPYDMDAPNCDTGRDEFLDVNGSNLLVTGGMTLKYGYSGDRDSYDNSWVYNDDCILENLTIEEFTSISSNQGGEVRRCNFWNLGRVDSNCRGDNKTSTWYGAGNTVMWRVYSANSRPHDVILYTGAGRPYVFGVENYIDATNSDISDQAMFRSYNTSSLSDLAHHYWIGNYIVTPDHGIQIYSAKQVKISHIHIKNNIIVRPYTSSFSALWLNYAPEDPSYITDYVVDGNAVYVNAPSSDRFAIQFGNGSDDRFGPGISVTNNVWGANLDGAGDPNSWSWGRYYTPGSPSGIYFKNNVKTNAADSTPNPGEWEFNSPTGSVTINNNSPSTSERLVTLNLTADDAESGMYSSPRWPLKAGALMRFSNDGITWADSRPYSKNSSWMLSEGTGEKTVWVSFRDVDGNWSKPYFDKIYFDDNGSGQPPTPDKEPSPPKGLRILGN